MSILDNSRQLMNDEEIRKYQKRCIQHAKRAGHSQLADDFAQEAIIKRVFANRKTTIKNLFIDFLRKEYGDTRTFGGRTRSSAMRCGTSLDQKASGDDSTLLHELVASPERDAGAFGFSWRNGVTFRWRDAVIAELLLDDEVSIENVALYLGVTPSRVHQVMWRVKKEIESSVMFKEVLPEYKSDPDASILYVEWIKL